MKKWEILVIELHGDVECDSMRLNIYSNDGWDLICIIPSSPNHVYRAYFKREIPDQPATELRTIRAPRRLCAGEKPIVEEVLPDGSELSSIEN